MLKRLKNSVLTGFGAGLVIPGILVGIIWFIMSQMAALVKADLLLIACIGVDALLLKYFFKQDKENIGRGVLCAAFLWAMAFLFYKIAQK